MARASQLTGEHARAVEHVTAEIAIRRETDDQRGLRRALELLRDSHLALGDQAAAADCVRRVRALDGLLAPERPLDV
ncbi:hypothetical protein ACFQY7_08700 [Actinomadura luteofluorescens]